MSDFLAISVNWKLISANLNLLCHALRYLSMLGVTAPKDFWKYSHQ
jgi:hypothetical protein